MLTFPFINWMFVLANHFKLPEIVERETEKSHVFARKCSMFAFIVRIV